MVAAASVITAKGTTASMGDASAALLPWQIVSWEMFETVGEYQSGINWLANGLSRVNLVAAAAPLQIGDEPQALNRPDPEDEDATPLTRVELRAIELVEQIAGGPSGQGGLMSDACVQLSVGGYAWIVAEPDLKNPLADIFDTWQVYSQESVKVTPRGQDEAGNPQFDIEIKINTGWRKAHPNALLIQCWRKSPRRWWEPHAPVKAALGVLETIDLLTAQIQASAKSRLAGAGWVLLPDEMEFPPPPDWESEDAPSQQDAWDYFVDQVTAYFTTPIRDRASAAAVVPYLSTVPGEWLDKIKHLTFGTPFDEKTSELLEQAIRRLATDLDMPPEMLLGLGSTNHWNADAIGEAAITMHIEPNAEVVTNALNIGFLELALESEGFTAEEIRTVMVWYDTSDLTADPDLTENVQAAYDRLEASGEALRRHSGLGEEDAPDPEEKRERVLLHAADGAPTNAPLFLGALGYIDPALIPPPPAAEGATGLPAPTPGSEAPAPPPTDDAASNMALLMACDGVVYRAMERAGTRLRSAVGRNGGGPQAVQVDDITRLHCTYDATVYSDLDHLLSGAWDRVPQIAERLHQNPEVLTVTLNSYCRGLLAAGNSHDLDRLAYALGA
jgi:hypothetical protein